MVLVLVSCSPDTCHCWYQTFPLRGTIVPAQRPTSSQTEHHDCWRQTPTGLSAVPAGWLVRRPVSKSQQLQCKDRHRLPVQVEFPCVLLQPWCPWRLHPGSTASGQCEKAPYAFSLRCGHALRLQCAATERDGVKCLAQRDQVMATGTTTSEIDIFVSSTGNFNSNTLDHLLTNSAFIGNTGHLTQDRLC